MCASAVICLRRCNKIIVREPIILKLEMLQQSVNLQVGQDHSYHWPLHNLIEALDLLHHDAHQNEVHEAPYYVKTILPHLH